MNYKFAVRRNEQGVLSIFSVGGEHDGEEILGTATDGDPDLIIQWLSFMNDPHEVKRIMADAGYSS